MHKEWLKYLICPNCGGNTLKLRKIVYCEECRSWYLLDDGVLELVPEKLNWEKKLNYYKNNLRFFNSHQLKKPQKANSNGEVKQKKEQASFFDEFFEKQKKGYQESPFWKAEYELTLSGVKRKIKKGQVIIDAGCGEGECSFRLYKKGIKIIGFDVSPHCIKKAIAQARLIDAKNDMFFFVGDAENPPIISKSADKYVLFAVLHHLVNPKRAVVEMSRVLKSGGQFFIHDNHTSKLRWIFDLVMKMLPLWKEDAAKEPLFSFARMGKMLIKANLKAKYQSAVFLPPHIYNILGDKDAKTFLNFSNKLMSKIPWLKDNGGVIIVNGSK